MKTLGICDSGFSRNLMNSLNVIEYKDFNSKHIDHGTNVLRVASSIFKDCGFVLAGVDLDSLNDVRMSLKWFSKMTIDALNISWVMKQKDEEIMHWLRAINSKGVKVFCAKSDKFIYPWSEFIGIDKEDHLQEIDKFNAKGSSISCAIHSGLYMKKISEKNSEDKHLTYLPNICEQLNLDI